LEFVVLLPLFILLSLLAWQLFLSGMAVIDSHAAVRDAVRVAATTVFWIDRLVLQLYLRRKQSLSVMIKPRHGLMSPSPIKPSPNMNQRNNLLPKDFFQE